jgi:protein-S-isoprenylcysteine O-methyltransferase Ste14
MADATPDHPDVIVFPPLLFGGALGIGLVLQWVVPCHPLPTTAARLLGAIVLIASVGLGAWGQRAMRRAGTNLNPRQPTLVIVGEGPFRLTRNPLYLSLCGAYVAIALLADALWPLVLLVPVVLVAHFGIVRREERYLEAKFGATYLAYKARTRRWL